MHENKILLNVVLVLGLVYFPKELSAPLDIFEEFSYVSKEKKRKSTNYCYLKFRFFF